MADFFAGGAAAMCAITIMHPCDVVKTRLQFQGEGGTTTTAAARGNGPAGHGSKPYGGVVSSLATILRHEGVRGLYRGIAPAYGLQFSVTAVRFSVYGTIEDMVPRQTRESLPEWERTMFNFGVAAFSGMVGSFIGNPFFALKTRAQAYSSDASLAVGTQHKPKPLVQAFLDIGRDEGAAGYFRGLSAFMPRVVAYGAVQLSAYDWAKRQLHGRFSSLDGMPLQASAAFVAAILAVSANQPFDFVTARLMNQPVDAQTGRGTLYRGPLDCAVKSVRQEGLLSLGKGLSANAARMGPYTVLVLVFNEQFKGLISGPAHTVSP